MKSVCVCVCVCVCIYIYIYIERERELTNDLLAPVKYHMHEFCIGYNFKRKSEMKTIQF